MFNFLLSKAAKFAQAVAIGKTRPSDEQYIVKEIESFKLSNRRKEMLDGEKYYAGKHDILFRVRTAIGEKGELTEVKNLPNNRVVDNQYRKMVDQKTNYLVGKPLTFQSDSDAYAKALKKLFNKKFQRTLKAVCEDSLNGGIAWLFVYYNEKGELSFKRIKPFELIPGWADAEHTHLDYAIRFYEVIAYEGTECKIIEKIEVYEDTGITYFELSDGELISCEPYFQNYFTVIDAEGKEQGFNWTRIPLIPFKYNSKEIPLISRVKSLQDGLNLIESNFQNQMEEDARNTILVLVNYDGENLGEFRKNLAAYGAVKVSTIDGIAGDLKTLQVEVNSENYKAILELFKKAIIENAMGYDAKDDRLAGNPNEMNIESMFSDIDLDADNMETEFQAAFEDLLWFVVNHFANVGVGNFEDEDVDIIFNRDMLVSEGDIIDNCAKSVGLLSTETILAMHPWVDDPQAELERIKKEKQERMAEYGSAFNTGPDDKGDEGGDEGDGDEGDEGAGDE